MSVRIYTAAAAGPFAAAMGAINAVVAVFACLGLAGFVAHTVQFDQLRGELTMQKAMLTQKCVEVIELQTLTNQTGLGASLALPNGVALGGPFGGPVNWVEELWDDANFWDPSEPEKIRLPGSGRYAFGLNCIASTVATEFDAVMAIELYESDDPFGPVKAICAFPTVPTQNIFAGYCEAEVAVQNGNFVSILSPGSRVTNLYCRFTVRRVGPLIGTGIGF